MIRRNFLSSVAAGLAGLFVGKAKGHPKLPPKLRILWRGGKQHQQDLSMADAETIRWCREGRSGKEYRFVPEGYRGIIELCNLQEGNEYVFLPVAMIPDPIIVAATADPAKAPADAYYCSFSKLYAWMPDTQP